MPKPKKNTRKKKATIKKTSGKKGRWHNLERDARGRWVKKKKSPNNSSKSKLISKQPASAIERPKEAEKVLNKIKHDFQELCPRCGGDMKIFSIRCGPNRITKVNKCQICNFWLPLGD
ncbi:MAG: hypothetical protein ACTSVL_04390 [Promethearchaeota archaeon]